jgi:hypothetical protein
MQTPNTHIAAHGSTVSRSGATPAATSQLQLKAAPAISAAIEITSQNLELPSTDWLFDLPVSRDGADSMDLVLACIIVAYPLRPVATMAPRALPVNEFAANDGSVTGVTRA